MNFDKFNLNTYKDETGEYQIYFADNYIELIDKDGKHYIDQFSYPKEGETVKGGNFGNELYLSEDGSYLEFIQKDKVLTTINLDNPVLVEENKVNESDLDNQIKNAYLDAIEDMLTHEQALQNVSDKFNISSEDIEHDLYNKNPEVFTDEIYNKLKSKYEGSKLKRDKEGYTNEPMIGSKQHLKDRVKQIYDRLSKEPYVKDLKWEEELNTDYPLFSFNVGPEKQADYHKGEIAEYMVGVSEIDGNGVFYEYVNNGFTEENLESMALEDIINHIKSSTEMDESIVNESYKTTKSKDWSGDEDIFKYAKPIFLKLVKDGKKKMNTTAFKKLVDDIVVANDKFMHANWRKNAERFFNEKVYNIKFLNEMDTFNVSRRDVMTFEDYLKWEKKGGASKPVEFKDYPNHLKGYQHEIDRAENFKHPHYDYTYRAVIGSSKGRHKADAVDPKEFDSKVEGTFKPEEDKRELPGMQGYNNGKFAVKESLNESINKVFTSIDGDRKISFHQTPSGNYEYAVMNYDSVGGEFEKPRYNQIDFDWLEEEKEAFNQDFSIFLDKIKPKVNETNEYSKIQIGQELELDWDGHSLVKIIDVVKDKSGNIIEIELKRIKGGEVSEDPNDYLAVTPSELNDMSLESLDETQVNENELTEVPFEDVQPGMKGKDYADEEGTVIATGSYDDLKQYDESGAAAEAMRNQEEYDFDPNMLVAVELEYGETAVYQYSPDGFVCYTENNQLHEAKKNYADIVKFVEKNIDKFKTADDFDDAATKAGFPLKLINKYISDLEAAVMFGASEDDLDSRLLNWFNAPQNENTLVPTFESFILNEAKKKKKKKAKKKKSSQGSYKKVGNRTVYVPYYGYGFGLGHGFGSGSGSDKDVNINISNAGTGSATTTQTTTDQTGVGNVSENDDKFWKDLEKDHEQIRKWLKSTTPEFDDFEWSGSRLTVYKDGKEIESYHKDDLDAEGVFN